MQKVPQLILCVREAGVMCYCLGLKYFSYKHFLDVSISFKYQCGLLNPLLTLALFVIYCSAFVIGQVVLKTFKFRVAICRNEHCFNFVLNHSAYKLSIKLFILATLTGEL